MAKIILDITMSLDGFIAGPDISKENPMGKGGLRLHEWLFKSKTNADEKIATEMVQGSGAVIVGNRTYATAIQDAWGGASPFSVPAFLLCREVPEIVVNGFEFVFTGIEVALEKAKNAAGGKNVWIMGGANTVQQYIKARLFDELHIHIAPVLLTQGSRLFEHIGSKQIELKTTQVIETTGAIHLIFTIVK